MTDLIVAVGKEHSNALESPRMRAAAPGVQAVAVFAAGFLLSLILLTSIPGFVGNDDYYHSRISALIIEQKNPRLDFVWLPETILSAESFVDHHLLYHLYLAPWSHWAGINGVKLAHALIIGGITLAFWSLLGLLEVRWKLAWTFALLALSSPFLYRMLMIRTQAAAVLLLLIALHLLFRRRYPWLVGLAFAFTWLYNGFVLLPAVVGLYVIAAAISRGEILWKALIFVLTGTLLGLIVNPYFPENIAFIMDHLGEKVDISEVRVGSEWYPYTTSSLLEHSSGAIIALVLGIVAGTFRKTGRDQAESTLLFVTLLTLYMLFRSRRFIEYFPIFSLLFCALAWGRGQISLHASISARMGRSLVLGTGVFALTLIVILSAITVQQVRDDIRDTDDLSYMAGAAGWLRENTAAGTLVFQTDWDDFTHLFYHNTQNRYLVGLDPTYLQLADPFLWNQWVAITRGQVERPASLIRQNFGTQYVVSDTRHEQFARRADEDPAMTLVFRDDNSLIWLITEE